LSAKDVVAQGKAAGIKFDDTYVYKIRRAAQKKGAGRKTVAKSSSKKTTARKLTATAAPKAATPMKAGESKADFVRERAHLSPKEIVEDAKAAGVELSVGYVYNLRGAGTKASKKTTAPSPTTKVASVSAKPGSLSVEDLLRAVAAELGLGRAMEILQGERARVRAVMGEA
jgi:hypothetical protein